MKRFFCTAAILGAGIASALAQASVVGDWLVKDGYAHIRIDNCGGKMWGIVAWEQKPGFDKDNPDPAKKTRPTLGMPILLGLTPTPKEPGKWSGNIYNSQDGKIYEAKIGLSGENTLDVEGCLMWPLCLTQKWTRVLTPPPNAPPLPPIKSTTAPPPAAKQVAAKKGGPPPVSDTCLRVADEAAAQEAANAKKK